MASSVEGTHSRYICVSFNSRFVRGVSVVNIFIAHCLGINILYNCIMFSYKAPEAVRGHANSVAYHNSSYIRQAI
jgi:hypothetical protein